MAQHCVALGLWQFRQGSLEVDVGLAEYPFELLVVEDDRRHPEADATVGLNLAPSRGVDDEVPCDAEQPGSCRSGLLSVLGASLERSGERLGDDVDPHIGLADVTGDVSGHCSAMPVVERSEIAMKQP